MRRHNACVASLLLIAFCLSGCSVVARSLGQTLNDTETTASIKYRLATDEDVATLTGIGVTTTDDWVYLTGTVDSEDEKERIEKIAAAVAGSNRVVSQLRVAGSSPHRAASD
ncbi:MAG: BON domain-containing protein [Candidatus Rokuibacteriota bacterium]